MEILHSDDGKKGSFYIEADSKRIAELTYTWAGDKMIIIDHTEVDDSLRGQNAGRKMLMQAVEYARSKKIKIIPLCPFANSMFAKLPEIRDVLQ